MLPRLIARRLASSLRRRNNGSLTGQSGQRRWLRAPRPGDGPMMSRRADRELPDIQQVTFRWGRTLPIFAAIIATCSVAIFNYQKMSSPVIASTMYALRTNPRARALLGDDIYFKHQIPWIHGEMNQMHGRIDVWFGVRGTRGTAVMRFASNRKTSKGMFETTEWSLRDEETGEWIDLLEGGDPFRGLEAKVDFEEDEVIRGFRQQPPLNR